MTFIHHIDEKFEFPTDDDGNLIFKVIPLRDISFKHLNYIEDLLDEINGIISGRILGDLETNLLIFKNEKSYRVYQNINNVRKNYYENLNGLRY